MILSQISRKLPIITVSVAIIASLSFFRKSLNILLNKVFVIPLISEFEDTIFNSLVLVLLSVSILLWLTIYGSKMFARQIGIISLGFYILMATSKFWIFYSFRFCPVLSNWDIIIIGFTVPMFLSIIKKNPILEDLPSDGFYEDLPIFKADEDSFNRKGIAKEIADKINITSNKKSFAIGILGEYGTGKTSFMNLIKTNLDTKKISVIEFNPWGVEGKSNIQQDFFDVLSSNLYRVDPKISGLVLDYSRKLARTSSTMEKILRHTGIIGSLFHESNYIDDYERINQLLESSGKKIVVIIDDLDRLYSEEVLEVLRIIRNSANFTNIFYLVAYDKSYVNRAVLTINANTGASYLDKIIQLEIPLPKRDSSDLQIQLQGYLELFLDPDDFKVFTEHILTTGFSPQYEYAYPKIFRQSRDIIKFINGFKLIYIKLKDEVFFESFFVLELLKFRFPLIYDRLYENKKDFVHEQAFATLESQFYELDTYIEDKESKISIIRKLRSENEYQDDEIKLIEGLLHHLFFGWERTKSAKNSIIHPMYFDRYFRYRIGSREISEKFFKKAFSGGLDKLKELIDNYADQNMIKETVARLFQLKALNRSEFELQVKALFYTGPLYALQQGVRNFAFDSLLNFLWDNTYNSNLKFFKQNTYDFKLLIISLFEEAPFPYLFHNEMIYHIRTDNRNFPLSEEELTDFQIQYFKKHLDNVGLSEDAVYIFYWTSEKIFEPLQDGSGKGYNRHQIKDKMAKLIVEVLSFHNPVNFLRMSIQTDLREKSLHTVNWTFLNLFSDPEELRNAVLTNTKISEEVKNEYLQFFDACKSNGFDRYTEFEFTTELKNKLMTSIHL
ncbi:KAP family P-loop domain-containing protein [Flavobacterium anhuiense]|uniref:KAP family P-loop domain-containing protein n=1 Tax=Flavobacterium anhuiense TaxID=459526 RepID=A0ABY0LXF3_9FLAO|nr:P-loop NTPase fold protein [Flavobacterium anhuiense]SCY76143.1 KAP family P-loop domain-containing protein [Flavobacterium anhuiense]